MKTSFLKKIFCLPNYLSLEVAGIEIGNTSVKYIEFSNKNGNYSIKNFGEIFLPQNAIKDGIISNRAAISHALSEVRRNLSSDFVKISIPEEQAYVFDVKIPREAKYNAREALEFKIEENVPLKLDVSLYEFEIVEDNPNKNDITLSVSVVHKKIISDFIDLLEQAGLNPIAFGVESIMVANSVVEKTDMKSTIVMNIKDDSTVLIGIVDGFVRQTSQISIGESTIRENLLKTGLFSDELVVGKYFENDFSFENTYSKESYSSLVNVFSIFKDEVEKFNEYLMTKFPSKENPTAKKASKIILCGKSSVLPGLAKHINQNINTEVVLANVFLNFFDVKEKVSNIKYSDSLGFVTPIGIVASTQKKC